MERSWSQPEMRVRICANGADACKRVEVRVLSSAPDLSLTRVRSEVTEPTEEVGSA